MENLTHSLIGATLAELTLPANATPAQRKLFFYVGIVASNLPDADLVYTRITAAPLGYLLHHRGHTHTVVGLVAQAALVGAVCMLPAIARRVGTARPRLWLLIALGLIGHLVADSWNSYGVHPFWPIDSRWFYGDAIYIVEPWLWLLLGVAAAWNAHRRRVGVGVGVLFGGLVIAFASFGMLPLGPFVALALGVAGASLVMRAWPARRRSAAALAGLAVFVGAMFAARQVVRAEVIASAQLPPGAKMMDVILNPQPANPLCWTAMSVVANEQADEYVMRHGTISLLSRWTSSPRCGMKRHANVEWGETERQSLSRLRTLDRDSCWVRGWLQFGRAPIIGERDIADLRFGGTARGNFSSMPLGVVARSASCPTNLTQWHPPRADLLMR